MITSRKASGKPRSEFAQITAPKITAAKRTSLAATITRLSVRIPCLRRLTTPDMTANA